MGRHGGRTVHRAPSAQECWWREWWLVVLTGALAALIWLTMFTIVAVVIFSAPTTTT